MLEGNELKQIVDKMTVGLNNAVEESLKQKEDRTKRIEGIPNKLKLKPMRQKTG